MPRGRPAKGTTKSQPAKAADEPEEEKPAEEEQVGGRSMRTRGKKTKAGDSKDDALDVIMGEQKKRGRKRKSVAAPEAEKSEESTAPDAKKDEEAGEPPKEDMEKESNVDAKDEPKDGSTDAPQPSQASQEGEIKVNRAPVLTMWVAAVAERQGFNFDEAVTFGKAISGLFAQSKGKRIGVMDDGSKEADDAGKKKAKKETEKFEVFGNSVYGKTTDKGRFAVESGKAIAPNTVKAYLHRAFKNDYERVKEAFKALANSFEPEEIGGKAYHLYEKFRPVVPDGARGWGARGLLDLKHVQELAASG